MKLSIRNPEVKISGVTYTLTVDQEDIEIKGNVLASGNEDDDRKAEEWTYHELERGNIFAWCWARVVAKADGFEGSDSLGCISCRGREEFERLFLPDLKTNALDDLRRVLKATIKDAVPEAKLRVTAARAVLAQLPKEP